ncbi:MAG: alanine--tRNA ligase-related protein [archaeon]
MELNQNSDLFSCNVKAVELIKKEKEIIAVFDNTIFYPGGGGQPYDTGKITSDSFEADIISVSKQNEKIIHTLHVKRGELKTGDSVHLEINKDRREKLVRMHTGEHMLFKSIENIAKDLTLVKIDLSENESSLFVTCDKLDWDILFRAEANVNSLIKENRKINAMELIKSEAANLKELRIKLDRIKTEKVRIINIAGFDYSACTGTHAESTSYVGNLFITKFAVNHGTYEIRYRTNVDNFFEYLNPIRKAATILGCDFSGVPCLVEKIISERDSYKENYRKTLEKIPVEFSVEKISGILFKSVIVENYERKKITDTMNIEAKENTIVCVINKESDRANVFLTCSNELKVNIPEKLKAALDKFGGKGGGRDKFAQGSVEVRHAEKIAEEIKKNIFS